MAQCPSCNSFLSGDSVFCSQCGGWLGGARSRRPRRKSRVPGVIAGLLFLALGSVFCVLWISNRVSNEPSGKQSLAVREIQRPGAENPSVPRGMPQVRKLQAVEQEEILDAIRATRLVAPTIVSLDLRKEDDRPLRETRGVLVDANGSILCRLSAMLGAHHGTCRFLRADVQKIEIVGLAYSVESLDLALVRVARVPNGITPLVILPDPIERMLHDGDTVFAVTQSRAEEAAVEHVAEQGPDRVFRLRLAPTPVVSSEAFLAVDSYGFVLGLTRLEVEGRLVSELKPRPVQGYRMLVDPAHAMVQGLSRSPTMSLAELSTRLFEGTFNDLFARGSAVYKQEKWKEAMDLLEPALQRASIDSPEPEDVASATDQLRRSYLQEARRLAGQMRFDEALAIAQDALSRFSTDEGLLLLIGELKLHLRDWSGAIAALSQVQANQPNAQVHEMLERAYIELASERERAGDSRAQELQLLQGIQQLPGSGRLYFELGRLHARFEVYESAVQYLHRAVELEPSLREAVEALLGKIDDALKRREAVIVPIAPGANSIRAKALVDEQLVQEFLIDTGASYTMLPLEVVQALGYVISDKSVVGLQTANGPILAHKIVIQSLNLGGYSVRNLEVVVVPRAQIGDGKGLLGLNFLNNFRYTVDASRNEFRLERP